MIYIYIISEELYCRSREFSIKTRNERKWRLAEKKEGKKSRWICSFISRVNSLGWNQCCVIMHNFTLHFDNIYLIQQNCKRKEHWKTSKIIHRQMKNVIALFSLRKKSTLYSASYFLRKKPKQTIIHGSFPFSLSEFFFLLIKFPHIRSPSSQSQSDYVAS